MSALSLLRSFLLNKYVVIVALVFVMGGYFEPHSFAYTKFSFLVPLYELDRYLCFIGVATVYILFGKKDLFCLGTIAVAATCCLSSYIYSGDSFVYILEWLPKVMVVLAVAAAAKNYFRELVAAVFIVTASLCALNLLSMIVYPNGVYESEFSPQYVNFFYAHRNETWEIAIPAILSSMLLDCFGSRKVTLRTMAVVAACCAMEYLQFSATTSIALTLMITCAVLVNFRVPRKLLNGLTYFGAYLVAFFSIVIFRVQDHLGTILSFIGKNVTFTGRTKIWDASLTMMSDPSHWPLGYGWQFMEGYREFGIWQSSAHDTMLQILLSGGLVAVAFFVAVLAAAAWRAFTYRDDKMFALLALAFGCVLVIGLTEEVNRVAFFLILGLMMYAPGRLPARIPRR
ncbi:O-antigen ligase family protein [Adlercreutzia mucosicola]|uniref:O-antigen ligase family protein n=1 Tax=Adlercreutzia mucosicola TaxID=580026 RepID=UPI00047FB837|nr:O-antigen ligase family protein [Adlercreutzia mucosicola]MCR2034218.1 O-antigen ligase family protein [Adlercreutzia mucosicola]